MIDDLKHLDGQLFLWLNRATANSFFDSFMPVATDLHKESWFAFVAVPMALMLWIFFNKMRALKVIAGLVLLIAITDNLNNRLLKPYFARPRPPAVFAKDEFHLRTQQYAGYAFPSNHAANNFAGAMFISSVYPWLTPFAFLIALFVGFSRIYVGVHYPGDIIVAALWASFFARAYYQIWRRVFLYEVRKE